MSFFDALFTILIKPLELLFEVIFALSYRIIPNPAVNLVIMSLAINFIVLPLYRRADIIQKQARDKEKELRPMSDHIKKYFKGDERVMIMQTFYRQERYNPLSSMKSLISLLLQIPFFIAAYQFLSHLPLLEGQKMGPIRDLLAPDGLLTIGTLTINVLPILMTVINIVSSEIYTRGQPFKDKIVLYLSAAIFLVLLYNSPAGLVFYWTFNNLFSLVKNIFYKLKNPGKVLKVLCAMAGAAGIVLLILNRSKITGRQFVFLMIMAVCLIVPLVLMLIKKDSKPSAEEPVSKTGKITYLFCTIYLAVLTGLLIPSQVVSSETSSFVNTAEMLSPSKYVWYSLFVALGVFVVWVSVFYLLSSAKFRKVITGFLFACSAVATVDYLFFGTELGILSSELRLEEGFDPTSSAMLINSAVVVATAVAAYIIYRFIPKAAPYIVLIGILAMSWMGIRNMTVIAKDFVVLKESYVDEKEPDIRLSKNGKNVVVIMLDRSAGFFMSSMLKDKSTLKTQYSGFTYYPNSVSFGCFTLTGAPGLFGGYEYTPEEMNKRPDKLLSEKYMESLMVMPQTFKNAGYKSQVMNLPLIYGHDKVSELREYEGIDVFSTSTLMNPEKEALYYLTDSARYRDFFLYSIFKTAPTVLQESIYSNGNYHSLGVVYDDKYADAIKVPQTWESISVASGSDARYLDNRFVLEQLPSYTTVEDDDGCHFFMFDNECAHQPNLLSESDGFTPSNNIDNTRYDAQHSYRSVTYRGELMNLMTYMQMSSYQVNMSAFIQIGKWFDYLKENDCYDNTRIIIVSDHARDRKFFGERYHFYDDLKLEDLNCILMYKDFGSTEFTQSEEFMTNADTPVLAMQGLIEEPVNPFTGNPINDSIKKSGPVHIFATRNWRPEGNTGSVYDAASWYSVHDSIFEKENWEYLGKY